MKLLQFSLSLVFLASASSMLHAGSLKDQRAHGAALFDDTGCRHCHTIGDKGGTKGPDLSSVGRQLTAEKIKKQIVEGGKQMPAFGESLQPSEVDDLIAYLRSLKAKKK